MKLEEPAVLDSGSYARFGFGCGVVWGPDQGPIQEAEADCRVRGGTERKYGS